MSEKITVTYEIPAPPKGWVYDGVRDASGEVELYYVDGNWYKWPRGKETGRVYPRAIRKKQWRPATEADIGRAFARFRDDGTAWHMGKLIHVFPPCGLRFAAVPDHNQLMIMRYEECEVPTEPAK